MFIWDFAVDKVIDELLDWVFSQIVGFLGDFFAMMGSMGAEIFDLPWVQAVVLFFTDLAWALFVVGLVLSCFEFAIGYASGRASIQQTAMAILKGFFAVSLFSTVPVRLYALSVSLQARLSQGLADYESIGDLGQRILDAIASGDGLAGSALSSLAGLPHITNAIMVLFVLIAMAYAVIKVFFANLKRGGILLIQIAVGSLYMFSVPRGYIDGFVQWCKQVIGLCLTAFLQATILTAGLLVFLDHVLLGLGLMLSATEVPRIAGAFGLDSATRTNISSAVSTAQAAINVTRTIAQFIR